jgi:hypothetical protein
VHERGPAVAIGLVDLRSGLEEQGYHFDVSVLEGSPRQRSPAVGVLLVDRGAGIEGRLDLSWAALTGQTAQVLAENA